MVDLQQQNRQENIKERLADYADKEEMNLQEALAVITYMNGHSPWAAFQDQVYRKAWKIIKVNAERVAEHRAE